ncbi:MAG: hypothetical protein CFE43_13420 [Burkholderiales bacterium PBB3]|nr:MAG: hypothetical protein CFE43_13420 [Burkholderiales bacterium PBB3]
MPPETPTAPSRKTSFKLAALTGAVLLAHVSLLYGTPVVISRPGTDTDAAPFSTRMIAAPTESPPTPLLTVASDTAPEPEATPLPVVPVAPTATSQSTALHNIVAPGPEPVHPDAPQPFAEFIEAPAAESPPRLTAPVGPVTLLAAADESKTLPSAAASPAPSRTAVATKAIVYTFPPPLHLKYTIKGEFKGVPVSLKGDLQWKQDGTAYDARLEVTHFLLGSRVQTSRGELGSQGLEPTRFGDKSRSERAAHFERSKGKITFSANTPDGALLPGTQDHLSVFFQLAAMLGGSPSSFPEGTTLPFEAVGPTSVESWVFKVGAPEKLTLPAGPVTAIKLARDAVGAYGTRGEVWLAPTMDYFPVRIRLTESNGDVMDLRWSETIAP